MSNTSLGAARKGSKFQMQRLTLPENQNIFNKFMGEKLNWISPLLEDKFREYQLNSSIILEELEITKAMKKEYMDSFWPSRQPQWDGIAWGKDNTLFLFEAKSHFSEIEPGKDGNLENDKKKHDSIMRCVNQLFKIEDNNDNRKVWCKKYYQISNRISFTYLLREISRESKSTVRYKSVKTIFLNFVNDMTWEKDKLTVDSSKKWEDHYNNILNDLNIKEDQLRKNNIYIMNFDLKLLEYHNIQ